MKNRSFSRLLQIVMLGYPDYRMMWAVEDFHKESLQNIEPGSDG